MNYGFEIVCASVFTVFCIISARVYSLLNKAYTYWDRKKINGPLPRYFIGTWSGFAEKFLGNVDYANVLKYGKIFGTYDGLTPNLLVTDPKMIEEIVSASADKFQNLRSLSENSVVLKDSLLCLCGGWNANVQILTGSLLSPHKFEKLFPKLESSIEDLINSIIKGRRDDGLVNISSSVTEFIDEVIALSVLGIELSADGQFKSEFVRNSEQVLKVKAPKSIWSLLPFKWGRFAVSKTRISESKSGGMQVKIYLGKCTTDFYESYFKEAWVCPEKSLQFFVNLIISKISESSTEAVLKEGKASNLIELMVEAAGEEKELIKKDKEDKDSEIVLTDNVIISKCVATIMSLRSLTRTTVIMGIHALASDEEVQEKLYKEIEKNKLETLSYEDIQNLNYLDKVVKEVLRLYPFEFRLERVTTDTVKLGETELNKGIRVSVPLYALHRLEENYTKPEEFDPERFSQSESEKRNAYTYLPFGQAGFNGSDVSLQLGVLASKITLLRLTEKLKFSVLQQKSLPKLFEEGFTRIPKPGKIELFAESRL